MGDLLRYHKICPSAVVNELLYTHPFPIPPTEDDVFGRRRRPTVLSHVCAYFHMRVCVIPVCASMSRPWRGRPAM